MTRAGAADILPKPRCGMGGKDDAAFDEAAVARGIITRVQLEECLKALAPEWDAAVPHEVSPLPPSALGIGSVGR